MKKKKVLIVMSDVGNGHRSAALALNSIFESKYKNDFEVKILDLFELADIDPFKSSNASYSLVSQNKFIEQINNIAFRVINTDFGYNLFSDYTLWRMKAECSEILKVENPDIVISVHPIISTVIKGIKLDKNNFKSVVVITDLITLFRGWADSSADLIFSPTIDAINTLIRFGVDKSKINAPFFPVNPAMSLSRSRKEVFRELEFDLNIPTILLTGGGLGSKNLRSAIKNLSENKNLQLIIIAGKLNSFKSELEYRYENNHRIKILGYVNNMQDYLNAADIVIGKPGPATIIEAEVFDKKMILTRKVGLQETGNIDYALRNPKFRYIGEDWGKLEKTIDELLAFNPKQIGEVRNRTADECEKIVDEVVKL